MTQTVGWTLQDWNDAYEQGQSPEDLLPALVEDLDATDPAWISLIDKEQLGQALRQLQTRVHEAPAGKAAFPLYGIPFAVKDNIDANGFPTTAACPEFSYTPEKDATVVALLKAAGAIVIGKTNLDQFATGLVGTRSPYGTVPNTFNPDYIGGGSSSGSASVVARGLVPFSLGTDTAGSGRVPAGLNNIVGLKPTRGAFSIKGVVPACRSLDCVSVFAHSVSDASAIGRLMESPDPADPFSRDRALTNLSNHPARLRRTGSIKKLAIPESPQWHGDDNQQQAWEQAISLWKALDVELVPLSFERLFELAELLYHGPWVAERLAAIEGFMIDHPDSVHPVVGGIVRKGAQYSATETFKAQYRQRELLADIDDQLTDIDALLVPTAPIMPTIEAVHADPVGLNSRMGRYTNFVNLADLCALAVPAGFRADGLPFGVTLISGAWRDQDLAKLAATWLNARPTPLGATDRERPEEQIPASDDNLVRVAVVGAHLSGMPLNPQLTERNARLLEETTTSENYRLYALPETTPPKPGLRRVQSDGHPLIVEVWEMTEEAFGSFTDLVPAPLGIGNVELADGRWVKGFICEGYALENARDVTEFGGWRAFVDAQSSNP